MGVSHSPNSSCHGSQVVVQPTRHLLLCFCRERDQPEFGKNCPWMGMSGASTVWSSGSQQNKGQPALDAVVTPTVLPLRTRTPPWGC